VGNPWQELEIAYFEDLALDIPVPEAARIFEVRRQINAERRSSFWPEVVKTAFEKAIEPAAQGALLLQREMTTLPCPVQRHASYKNLGEILDFHTAYWCNRFDTLMGKPRSAGAMSTKVPPM
jgi:hypothetical protein